MGKGVLITGGTGFIGRHLSHCLSEKGYEVKLLSRYPEYPLLSYPVFKWDIDKEYIDLRAFRNVSCLIHLAGENIGEGRWSRAKKQRIVDSRVKSLELVYDTLKNNSFQIQSFISASAVGYYEDCGKSFIRETNIAGLDFLANTCRQWENAAAKMGELGIRTVILRQGLVLGRGAPALEMLVKSVKLGIAPRFGSGTQYMSWIHLQDLLEIYAKAIADEGMSDIFNAVSPYPVTNEHFVSVLASCMNKSIWLPYIPEFIIRGLLGEKGNMLFTSIRASADKLISAGYNFKYPDIEGALKSLIEKKG